MNNNLYLTKYEIWTLLSLIDEEELLSPNSTIMTRMERSALTRVKHKLFNTGDVKKDRWTDYKNEDEIIADIESGEMDTIVNFTEDTSKLRKFVIEYKKDKIWRDKHNIKPKTILNKEQKILRKVQIGF